VGREYSSVIERLRVGVRKSGLSKYVRSLSRLVFWSCAALRELDDHKGIPEAAGDARRSSGSAFTESLRLGTEVRDRLYPNVSATLRRCRHGLYLQMERGCLFYWSSSGPWPPYAPPIEPESHNAHTNLHTDGSFPELLSLCVTLVLSWSDERDGSWRRYG